ncbi:hypothetical protein JIN85_18330 [Luteolibacter pohnpeiensis]|uniref:Uncharacterized protein n=1 Tax=Luteolibacter pohnpeiensis TaxID=454153 RepID=A0A934S7Y7_9BACT|nr:hypothetical protein [Luteolibacter pohnpeiensis]MBK1884381.1 hypothetical protein [Luteolibacter pohnpeiensis]
MVDRTSRDLLALRLRQYVSGRIINDDLDDTMWEMGDDPGAVAVSEMAWQLYDDTLTHRATGRHHIDHEGRREISRWILFLDSDLEYEWPRYSFIGIDPFILSLITFGIAGLIHHRRWKRFVGAGPFEIWPFMHQEDLDRAIKDPRRLAGTQDSEQDPALKDQP